MTPDSKKITTAKIPAKKTVARKTAVSTKKAPVNQEVKKTAVSPKEAPAKEAVKKTAITPKETSAEKVAKKTAINPKETPAEKVVKKTAVSAKEAPAKKVAKKSTLTSRPHTQSTNISSEERWKMIATAAYHKAEKRGFAPGGEQQDWAEAEQEIDELLNSG